MSWPSRTVGTVYYGGVKLFGQDAYDRDDIMAGASWTWATQNSAVTASMATIATGYHIFPGWAEATATITVTFSAIRLSGSGTFSFRLGGREAGGSYVYGTALNSALTTSLAPYEVSLAVPASPTWAGVMIELILQGQDPGTGESSAGLENVFSNLRIAPV